MIERVARAIAGKDQDTQGITWEDVLPYWQDVFIQQAKAAIEAMREPTEEMLNEFDFSDTDWIERYWKPAIDAALKE